MARPDRGKFASGPAGQARYVAALKKHLANKKKAEEARKITSTKKNIEKQKTANKKTTVATTKTTKGTTSAKPKSTTAKGKSLATGKTTSKTKAVETPQTTTATKTRTKTRTQTKSKTTPKKTVTPKKPVANKPVAKKPVAKKPVVKKPVAKKPLISNKNKLRIKKGVKTTADTTKKVFKKSVEQTKKVASNLKNKVDATKKVLNKKSPNKRPTTRLQKLASKGNKVIKNVGKYGREKVLPKAGKDLLKIGKGILKDPKSLVKGAKGAGISYLAERGIDAATTRLLKPKNMTVAEYKKGLKQFNKDTGVIQTTKRTVKGLTNLVRGKNYTDNNNKSLIQKKLEERRKNKNNQSSTTNNINNQKKTNNNLSAKNINKNKNKKNFYNTPDGKSPKAKEIATLQKNIRNAKGANKELLQKKLNYLQKFGKMSSFTVDKNSKEYKEALRINKSLPTTSAASKSAKPGSARAKLRQKNIDRFGEAHVNKLRAKNKDFQSMKKKKLTKAEFIRRYPNSQTAKRARGM